MSKTREEILEAKTAHEVFEWLKEDPSRQDKEVCAYFNQLAKDEFRARIPNYDPDIHYDFGPRKK